MSDVQRPVSDVRCPDLYPLPMAHAYPTISADALPWLSVEQMIEADRLAIEHFDIELLQMMEHAGSGLARLTDRLAPPGPITALAGGGNNGGGGLCAARHLANLGQDVEVVMASDRLGPAARHHLATLEAMRIDPAAVPSGRPVVVDAMVGYGLNGPLRGRAAELAGSAEESFIVSLDIPSGHGSSGAVRPSATLTLALPKAQLRRLQSLYVSDLGLPAALWQQMEIDSPPLFAAGPIVLIEP